MNNPSKKEREYFNPNKDHFFSEGVHFDKAFSRIRKQRKSNFKVPEQSRINLENSIKRLNGK